MGRLGIQVSFEDGETHTQYLIPSSLRQYIATVSPDPTKYTGKFGIDWVKMDASFSTIDTFQETNVADISHIVDGPTSSFITTGTSAQKQDLVRKIYEKANYHSKDYPITWINLSNGETADLHVNTFLLSGRNRATDFLTITKNPNFEIEYNGITDAGGTPVEILLPTGTTNAINAYKIKITAKATFTTKQEIKITDYLGTEVGRIEMVPNDTVNLDIRIVPVVFKSNTVTEVAKAETLHRDALNGGLLNTTLNEKSLNQAGIKSIIEGVNISARTVAGTVTRTGYIAVDLSNTTDKWSKYYRTSDNTFKDWYFSTADPIKPSESTDDDGKPFNPNRPVDPPTKKPFLDKLKEAYPGYDTFKGAIIFVTDKEYSDPSIPAGRTLDAYSQNDPLRNKGVVVFNSGMLKGDVYAHEIGHVLGAEHPFFENENNKNLVDATKNTTTSSIAERKIEVSNDITTLKTKNFENKTAIKNGDLSGLDLMVANGEVTDFPDKLKALEDKLQRIGVFSTITNFKVTQSKTTNYMDYDINRTYFNKNQANILKDEVKKYYK